ncbi:MAG: DUF4173 domain-containing protein [Lachnospiraceae bacterium]|nr:DUF4173 domain-containing protein [Lachnospiraceae bacterium]
MPEEVQKKHHFMQDRMTERFLTFGTISLIFGVLFAACFYKAGLGLSYTVFTGITVVLLNKVSKELYNLRGQKKVDENELQNIAEAEHPGQKDENLHSKGSIEKFLKNRYYTKFCYGAAFLISLSAMFTASEFLWLLDTVAILMLLELSLIVEITGEKEWSVGKYFGVMIHMFFLSIFGFMYPFMDGVEYAKTRKKKRSEKVIQILTGLCIAIPILFVVISLLASSDAIFSGITSSIMKGIFVSGDPLFILILAFVMAILCYAVIKAVCCLDDQFNEKDAWNRMCREAKSRSYTFITVVASLTAVYVIYVGIQIVMLLGRSESMLPAGMTYAEYAREGFFELLVVTLINFIVVLCCLKEAKESKVLQILLLIFSACTFGMIFSAGYRIILYISVYHLTMLRLMVVWFLVLNCLLMTGAIIGILREGFPLFRYCVAAVSICFIILSFGKPDAVIASYNMKHDADLSRDEITYLAMLSADAAPYVMPLLEEKNLTGGQMKSATIDYSDLGTWDLISFGNRILIQSEGRGIRGFNVSYQRAKKAAKEWDYQYIQQLY